MTRIRQYAALGSLIVLGCSGLYQSPDVLATRPRPTVEQPGRVETSALATANALPPSVSPPSSVPAPPTPSWATIYARYFGPKSEGACGRSRTCHADAMTDSLSAYRWLAERGYIAGTESPLVSRTNSCLLWFGGNMPPRGTPSDAAVRDLTAWVAGGAASN